MYGFLQKGETLHPKEERSWKLLNLTRLEFPKGSETLFEEKNKRETSRKEVPKEERRTRTTRRQFRFLSLFLLDSPKEARISESGKDRKLQDN